jgi:hypothetical protein
LTRCASLVHRAPSTPFFGASAGRPLARLGPSLIGSLVTPVKLSRKLPLVCSALVLATVLAGLWGLQRLYAAIGTYQQTLDGVIAQERGIAAVQTDFKTQVQEWKNVLLRGKDPAARDRHWAAFVDREAQVGKDAQALLKQLPPGDWRNQVEAFVLAHAHMGAAYRKGYADFQAAQADPVVGDKAVSGIDREPTRRLDELGTQLASAAAEAVQQAARVRDRALLTSLLLMAAALAGGVVVGVRLSRSITGPLGDAVALATAVADGRWCRPCTASRPAAAASPRSSASSMASRSRPTSWHSTRRSRPRGRASRAAALPWWPARCGCWRGAVPRRRARSRRSSVPASSRSTPAQGWWAMPAARWRRSWPACSGSPTSSARSAAPRPSRPVAWARFRVQWASSTA